MTRDQDTYEHNTFGYRIELLSGWEVESEGVHELLLSKGNWPWPEIIIEYTPLPDGADGDDQLVRLAESSRRDWEQWTRTWDKSEVKSFERESLDGQDSYWIRYYGHESPQYCDIDMIERVLITSHGGRMYGVVLEGRACSDGEMISLQDLETMLRSFSLPTSTPTPTAVSTPTSEPTPTPTSTPMPADLVVNVVVRTSDAGTAWVFSYPDLSEALWFENEVYLPVQSSVQFVINAFDDAPYRITADELFEPFDLVQNARGVVLVFETSEEQYVLGEATGSQVQFHVLPREEFEEVVTSREGCANGVVVPNPQVNPGPVRDCGVLLQMRDTLVGDGKPLNWDVDTLISDWEGVWQKETLRYRFDGTVYVSYQLGVLDLSGLGLAGCVPDALMSIQVDPRDLRFGGLPFCSETTPSATPVPTPTVTPTATTTPIPASTQRAELTALYNATDGDNWANNANWLSDKPIGEWHGVKVDDRGQVVGLRLINNQLTGEIPSGLGELVNLIDLSLTGNQLSGEIPSELGKLVNLKRLGLINNRLSGEIPPELGKLVNLEALYLDGNQLSGEIPSELGELVNLRRLWLRHNQLIGEIPSELGNLTSLKQLTISHNRLSGELPSELGNLVNLELLRINDNSISDISPLAKLTKLTEASLYGNEIFDLGPMAANAGLGDGDVVDVRRNPLDAASINEHVPELQARGVVVLSDGEIFVFTEPQIYNDNVFVLPVSDDLNVSDWPLSHYARRFYEYFDDQFDFLMFTAGRTSGDGGMPAYYRSVSNEVEGIGVSVFSNNDSYRSAGKLQGVIRLPGYANVNFPYPSSMIDETALHEVMHRWANFVVPTSNPSHWGFSSADGVLGGFDIARLEDLGGGMYSVEGDLVDRGGTKVVTSFLYGLKIVKPYSPIELYLAGFIPPEEVPDLWVAEDGILVQQKGLHTIFAASQVRTYTIEDIISEHGPRTPDDSQSQKVFRAAAILLVNEEFPATQLVLDVVSGGVSWFSHAGDNEEEYYNFYEATDGRGTITMDGLSQFWKGSR